MRTLIAVGKKIVVEKVDNNSSDLIIIEEEGEFECGKVLSMGSDVELDSSDGFQLGIGDLIVYSVNSSKQLGLGFPTQQKIIDFSDVVGIIDEWTEEEKEEKNVESEE